MCIRFYVLRKLSKKYLAPAVHIPARIDGIPTDVIQASQAAFYSDPHQKIRPLVGGISAANSDVSYGTLGCVCKSTLSSDSDKDRFILSCDHVLAALTDSRAIQQSKGDDGDIEHNYVADIHRRIPIGVNGNTTMDVAIAKLRTDQDPPLFVSNTMSEIMEIGKLKSIGELPDTAVQKKLPVQKYGAATMQTHGFVTDLSCDVTVVDDRDQSSQISFTQQIRIETNDSSLFADHGDSGAIVVLESDLVGVGIVVAGSSGVIQTNHPDSNPYVLASPLKPVFDQLRISLITP
jgi:hypothetical protein